MILSRKRKQEKSIKDKELDNVLQKLDSTKISQHSDIVMI